MALCPVSCGSSTHIKVCASYIYMFTSLGSIRYVLVLGKDGGDADVSSCI